MDDQEILSALLSQLAEKVGKERFDLWFQGATQLIATREGIVVEVQSRFLMEYLRKQFLRELEAVSLDVYGTSPRIEFQVNEHLTPSGIANVSLAATCKSPREEAPVQDARGPYGTGPSKTRQIATQAGKPPAANGNHTQAASRFARRRTPATSRKLLTFDDFIVGDSNRLAYTSARLAIERPGQSSPLLLHGRTGLGKSHLLEAILTAARRDPRRLNAVYLSAEQFTTLFLEAMNGRGLPSFRQKYRGVDILLLDDIQFLIGKKATLVELHYTIDSLLREGRQVVLTGDRQPSQLKGLGRELVARLHSGLVCGLEPPDYQTRVDIVQSISRRLNMEVTAEIGHLIASQITAGAREITGALKRLHITSLATGQQLDRSLAESALAELAGQGTVVRLADIERAVCDVLGMEPDTLQSDRKSKAVSYPRMLAMFLARKYTRAALSEIGHYFGRRSHSTVVSAQKKVESWMQGQAYVSLAGSTWPVEDAIRRVEDHLRVG